MRGPRPLRTRLFLWFLGAIVVAFASSAVAVGTSRPEAFTTGAEVLAHTVASRLADSWDDPPAAEGFVNEVRRVTGFEVRLFRDPRKLPANVARAAQRGNAFAPNGPERVFVPIVRNGVLVGALQMERYGGGFRKSPLWRLALALAVALLVIVMAAGYVSNQIARPLEKLGDAASRFGAGDLAFRTDLADAPKRWVALEVHRVAVAFNEMAQRLEATVRGQRELLAAISHELRSPLGRARVALEIARDRAAESRGAPALGNLDDVEKQLTDVDAILGDLLALTRAGLADLHRERFSLVPWIQTRLEEERAAGDIALKVNAPDDLAVLGDRPLLARALHNVVANAQTHGHAPIEMSVERVGDRVRIVVRDRGPGFAPNFLVRAFEPFVRGDTARSRHAAGSSSGTGLGLAIVRRIAEAHGGTVTAANLESPDGPVGAEVAITLPVAFSLEPKTRG